MSALGESGRASEPALDRGGRAQREKGDTLLGADPRLLHPDSDSATIMTTCVLLLENNWLAHCEPMYIWLSSMVIGYGQTL